MSTIFAKFKDANGVEIFVNPLLVRYFRSTFEDHEDNLTTIIFDNDASISVVSSLENVQKSLTF